MTFAQAPELALLLLFVIAAVPLLPTEAAVIGCAVLAADGEVHLITVILVATAGCLASDLFNYTIGSRLGMRALQRFETKPRTAAALAWLRRQLDNRGEPMMVAGRFIPGGGIVGAVLAGAFRMGMPRFLPVATIGSALWSTYATLIGYTGGQLISEPFVAIALSIGMTVLVSLPIGYAVKRAQAKDTVRERAADYRSGAFWP
ncbi:DedA family protein [Allokutzneria albata]|uniref:Membrane protein DedA, SNARE-associated domain n=1 Tax=Allokutzneria albata TaxID=211114 RepID=A0A1H0AFG1_ALLAB|nr:DedA family protein [Allokutzneria albata]SDN32269.1 membrane protein DedA, SNARE-associated domain [Allokutzneria albata]